MERSASMPRGMLRLSRVSLLWLLRLVPLAVAWGPGAGTAFAQTAGYAVDRYEPSEAGSDWFTTESLDLRGSPRVQAGVVGDWAYRPLSLDLRPNAASTAPIVDQVILHHRASVVLLERFRVAVSLPVAVYQHGDGGPGPAAPPRHAQALGDLRLGADARLFHAFPDRVRGAIGVQVFLPTGQRGSYTGDETVRAAPRFLLAGSVAAFDWAIKLGYAFRPHDGVFAGRTLGSDVFGAVSAGVKVNDRFVIGPEVHGTATVTGRSAGKSRAIPVEVLLGARVRLANDFQAGTAIGTALSSGDGAPKMRVLAMFEWAPDDCVDKDGDGICAPQDACPEVAGRRTNDRATNGCPAPGEIEAPPRIPEPAGSEPEAPPVPREEREREAPPVGQPDAGAP